MEKLTIERIDDIIQATKERCPHYGEPDGCNSKDGPEDCCDNLDDLGEFAKTYTAIGTVEHLTELCKAEQQRREGCEYCDNHAYVIHIQHNVPAHMNYCYACGRDLRGESHDRD